MIGGTVNRPSLEDLRSFWIIGKWMGDTVGGSDAFNFSFSPFQHLSLEAANKEAARLVRAHGGRFAVFECLSVTERIDIVRRDMKRPDEDDGIPF